MVKNPRIILIGGAPYVGKSTISLHLAKKLNITQVVDTDVIREVLRSERLKKEYPYLFLSSCTAWEHKNKKTKKEIIKACIEYCKILDKSVKRIIDRAYELGKDTIIEGVHILPSSLERYIKKKNFYIFLISCEKERHLRNIKKRKQEFNKRCVKRFYKRFPVARMINEYLKDQAKKYKVNCIDNYSLKKTENKIAGIIYKNGKN